MPYSIALLNQMTQDEFIRALGAIFEHTPEIADRTWYHRPFTDIADLHAKMVVIVNGMTQPEKLALIQAHPDLGSKTKMAEASVKEQTGAGLDRLSPEEYERFHSFNQAYRQKFGFPFIIAVKNQTKASILEAFDRRIHNSIETEMQQAIAEIVQIAEFRLAQTVDS